jgi:hypothetical protein
MSTHWLGKLPGTENPHSYFELGGPYAVLQFDTGWRGRNKLSARTEGEASHTAHPDAEKQYAGLMPEVKEFVNRMAQNHLLLYLSLTPEELKELREIGARDGFEKVTVPEPLLSKVNERHHDVWLATRALCRVFGLAKVTSHTVDKARNLMTPDEIKADDSQVQAYAVNLSRLPDDVFEWLIASGR